MAAGQAPENVLKKLTETDPARDLRQVGMVDAQGRAASFTGKRCTRWAGHKTGDHYAAQGNLLAGEAVVTDMAAAFEKARKQPNSQLADWLIAAVTAAEAAGGDKRGDNPLPCWLCATRVAMPASMIASLIFGWMITKLPSRNSPVSSSFIKNSTRTPTATNLCVNRMIDI